MLSCNLFQTNPSDHKTHSSFADITMSTTVSNINGTSTEVPTTLSVSTPSMSPTLFPAPTVSPTIASTYSPSSKGIVQYEVNIFLIVFMVFWIAGNLYCRRNELREERERSDSNAINTEGVKKLSIEDWIGLYNRAFRSTGNRTILKSENIVTNQSQETTHQHDEDVFEDIELGNDDDDMPSIYLSLDKSLSRTRRQSSRKSVVRRSLVGLSSRSSVHNACSHNAKISGTCVICFENFEPGDEVVWAAPPKDRNHGSDESSVTQDNTESGDDGNHSHNDDTHHTSACHQCHHVYHQECMVHYLATNAHRRFRRKPNTRIRRAEDIENPCPICRQDFCSIAHDDLEQTIEQKGLEINGATGTETGGSSNTTENSPREASELPAYMMFR